MTNPSDPYSSLSSVASVALGCLPHARKEDREALSSGTYAVDITVRIRGTLIVAPDSFDSFAKSTRKGSVRFVNAQVDRIE